MKRYIDKDALAAEIEKRIKNLHELGNDDFLNMYYEKQYGSVTAYRSLLSFLNTLEVKEVDLDDKIDDYINAHYSEGCDGGMISDAHNDIGGVMYSDLTSLAEHFFKLGMRVNNPITSEDRGIAEEIIISLKQVENDYYLDQTKEIEWVRNKVKEEEEV